MSDPLWFIVGGIMGLFTLSAGYWLGYRYAQEECRDQERKHIMETRSLQSTIHHHENTIAMQDTAIDTLRDHGMCIKVDDGYATMGGKVIDLLSHRKGDC